MDGRRHIIVAYFTPGPYELEARRLRDSLDRLGLVHRIEEVRSAECEVRSNSQWRANAHIRPAFLQEMRRRFPDETLLSLDADAVVHKNPWDRIPAPTGSPKGSDTVGPCDIACHNFKGRELLPGTLVINPTPAADRMLEAWRLLNIERPNLNDRVNFAEAVRSAKCEVRDLPPELCWIFDLSEKAYRTPHSEPAGEPAGAALRTVVIEHLQASRSFSGRPGIKPASRLARIEELEACHGR